jgi:hypothetical protein
VAKVVAKVARTPGDVPITAAGIEAIAQTAGIVRIVETAETVETVGTVGTVGTAATPVDRTTVAETRATTVAASRVVVRPGVANLRAVNPVGASNCPVEWPVVRTWAVESITPAANMPARMSAARNRGAATRDAASRDVVTMPGRNPIGAKAVVAAGMTAWAVDVAVGAVVVAVDAGTAEVARERMVAVARVDRVATVAPRVAAMAVARAAATAVTPEAIPVLLRRRKWVGPRSGTTAREPTRSRVVPLRVAKATPRVVATTPLRPATTRIPIPRNPVPRWAPIITRSRRGAPTTRPRANRPHKEWSARGPVIKVGDPK